MSATTVMILAIMAAVVGRWAHGQQTASAKTLLEATFAVVVIAAMDNGRTEPIAKGFAWIFLAAVLLSPNSPLTGIANAIGPSGTVTL